MTEGKKVPIAGAIEGYVKIAVLMCLVLGLRRDMREVKCVPRASGDDAVLSFKAAHVECGRLWCVARVVQVI
jgi:hypothetical protein